MSDWRLTNQMSYLYRAKLKRCQFKGKNIADHEHCEFCMEKFSFEANTLKEGYCTLDQYRWICEECFEDFKEIFEWEIVDP